MLTNNFQLPSDMPTPTTDASKLALALYREAISVRSVSYEFLSFLKILNIGCHSPQEQIDWINATISELTQPNAKERLSELAQTESNIGSYLYGSGRCAVAHASEDPVVDPDGGQHLIRLRKDLPVARGLAEFRIEEKFGMLNWYTALQRRRQSELLKTARQQARDAGMTKADIANAVRNVRKQS